MSEKPRTSRRRSKCTMRSQAAGIHKRSISAKSYTLKSPDDTFSFSRFMNGLTRIIAPNQTDWRSNLAEVRFKFCPDNFQLDQIRQKDDVPKDIKDEDVRALVFERFRKKSSSSHRPWAPSSPSPGTRTSCHPTSSLFKMSATDSRSQNSSIRHE